MVAARASDMVLPYKDAGKEGDEKRQIRVIVAKIY